MQQTYSKFTHAFAGLMGTLAAFYAVSGDFRDWVSQLGALYAAHVPHILQPLPALAVALWMWYRNGKTATSTAGGPPGFIGSAGPGGIAGRIGRHVGPTVTALFIMCMVTLVGCSPIEIQAYRVVVGSKAFTKSLGNAHPECGTRVSDRWQSSHNSGGVCVAIDKGIAAKDVLIDLTEQYCSGSDFETGGACNPPTDKTVRDQLAAKVKFAIQNYESIETDIKALLH